MTADVRVDLFARVIAAAIWTPQPDMSGDIWRRVTATQRRRAEDAATSVLELIIGSGAADTTTSLRPCPFCRSVAELDRTGYEGPADCYDVAVICTGCDARGPVCVVDRSAGDDEAFAVAMVIEGWNRRQ